MKVFNFDLPTEKDVIIVNAVIENKYLFRLVVDTAATHSTIDSNVLYFSGYELKNSNGEQEIETSQRNYYCREIYHRTIGMFRNCKIKL